MNAPAVGPLRLARKRASSAALALEPELGSYS
jgi:hypothetical protein